MSDESVNVTMPPAGAASAEQRIDFPVGLRPIAVEGCDARSYRAVVREDTGAVLAVHRRGYCLVRNAEVYGAFEEALRGSDLVLEGMSVQDALSHGGARTMRTYRFPAHHATVQSGDRVDLELRVLNSYDGSSAFSAIVGGHRLVCSNGLVLFEEYSQVYARHTRELAVAEIARQLCGVIPVHRAALERWRAWSTTRLTDEQARAVLGTMPEISTRLLERLMEHWARERAQVGPTVWALYNAATYWSTHEAVRAAAQANAAAVVLDREQRVRRMLASPAFARAAA